MGTETSNVTETLPATDTADTVASTETTTDDGQPAAEPEERTLTFRVLRRDENTIETVTRWIEAPGALSGPYHPTATEVGEMFGEGDYLLIEQGGRYSFCATYPMTVVAEKRYRRKREDES